MDIVASGGLADPAPGASCLLGGGCGQGNSLGGVKKVDRAFISVQKQLD